MRLERGKVDAEAETSRERWSPASACSRGFYRRLLSASHDDINTVASLVVHGPPRDLLLLLIHLARCDVKDVNGVAEPSC